MATEPLEQKNKAFTPDTNIMQEQQNPAFEVPQTPAEITPEINPLSTQEQLLQKEQIPKKMMVDKDNFLDDAIHNLKRTLRKPKNKKHTIPQIRDELTVEIEHVMEAGLKEAFNELSPVQQQEFKIKGEKTALQIRQLLQSTKIKVKSIIKLLIEWLKLLPGVNRFFLEQEAKIKADKIMAIKDLFSHKR